MTDLTDHFVVVISRIIDLRSIACGDNDGLVHPFLPYPGEDFGDRPFLDIQLFPDLERGRIVVKSYYADCLFLHSYMYAWLPFKRKFTPRKVKTISRNPRIIIYAVRFPRHPRASLLWNRMAYTIQVMSDHVSFGSHLQ